MAKNYKITTNAVALSKAWTALNSAKISGIPQVEAGDDIEEIAFLIVRNVGFSPQSFNMFFQAITDTTENFVDSLSDKEATELAVNFCKSISSVFLLSIKKYLKESKELKDSIMVKTKMMQAEKMMELVNNPEEIARILKSFSGSENQD